MEKTYTIELTEKEVIMIRLALAFRFDDLNEEGRTEKAAEYDQLWNRFVKLTFVEPTKEEATA